MKIEEVLIFCKLIFVTFASSEVVEILNPVESDYPTTQSIGRMTELTPSWDVCYEIGECLFTNLIDVTYVNTTVQCLEDCKNTEGCQWFTYKFPAYRQPFCELFTLSCVWSNDCTNCTIGHVTCPEQQCNILGRCKVTF